MIWKREEERKIWGRGDRESGGKEGEELEQSGQFSIIPRRKLGGRGEEESIFAIYCKNKKKRRGGRTEQQKYWPVY